MSSALTNEEVVAQMNAAAGLGVTAGLQAVTLDAADAFEGSVAKRTGILTDFGAGYASDIYAGVFGADYTAPCGGTLGAAITFGTADTDSKNTIASTSADSDYWGFSIYGAKAFGNAKIAADFGYMAFSNDVTAGLGISKFSADTDAVTFGVRGEYLYEAEEFKIVPHAGLRYTHLATDGFEAAFRTDVDSLNVWRKPIGVTVSGNVETNGRKLAPSVDLTVVPALGVSWQFGGLF